MTAGLSTTAIFGDLCSYFFGNVRDKTSKQQYYMAICYPLSACNWLQNEWPWVPISRKNPFSTSKAVARLPLRLLGFLVLNVACSYNAVVVQHTVSAVERFHFHSSVSSNSCSVAVQFPVLLSLASVLGLELSSRTNLESLALALRVSPWSWPSGPWPVGLVICQTYTATVVMT